jgi:hypothetical protein
MVVRALKIEPLSTEKSSPSSWGLSQLSVVPSILTCKDSVDQDYAVFGP